MKAAGKILFHDEWKNFNADQAAGRHGITGVNGQVDHDLLHLHRVNPNEAGIRIKGEGDLDIFADKAAQHLLKLAEPPSVIFTTAFNDHALRAFELHAVDYLVKPIRLRRLHEALTRARSITPLRLDVLQRIAPEPRRHLSIQERGKVMLIALPDILYLRAELKYVTVRTAAQEYLVEESLSRLEQEFADQFVRIHRSCLVAKAHIVGFEKESAEAGESRWVVLLNGLDEKLPVSRRQQHIVKDVGRNLL